MNDHTYWEALETLSNNSAGTLERERAIRYLSEHPDEQAIRRIIEACEDDDFGVRWEAARALARAGKAGLAALLQALADPERVGHTRLRRSAYWALEQMGLSEYKPMIWNLMLAMKGPGADIATMEEAHKLLQELRKKEETELS